MSTPVYFQAKYSFSKIYELKAPLKNNESNTSSLFAVDEHEENKIRCIKENKDTVETMEE